MELHGEGYRERGEYTQISETSLRISHTHTHRDRCLQTERDIERHRERERERQHDRSSHAVV